MGTAAPIACPSCSGADAGIPGEPRDGGAPADSHPPPTRRTDEEIPSEADVAAGLFAASERLLGCFDGDDPDADGLVDCRETVCQQATPACCVGIASAECCALPAATLSLDFSTCTTGSPAACTTGTTAFGIAAPYVIEPGARAGLAQAAIVMDGSDASDSGLIVTQPIDFTTRRVALTARIGVPATCDTGCVETAAIAVTGRGDYAAGRAEHVRPLLALIVSASRHSVLLVQGEAVVASTGIASEVATYTLSLEPGGDVVVTGGVEVLTTRWAPPSAGHLALYGRSVNPAAETPPPARFEMLTLSEGLCEMPSAWGARRQVLPQLGATGASTWTTAPRALRAPSISTDATGSRVLAVESERGIYLAGEAGDGSYVPLSGDNVALAAGHLADGTDADHVGEPSLVQSATQWVLYVTVADASGGKRWIARTTAPMGSSMPFPAAEPVAVMVPGMAADAELSSPEVVVVGSPARLELFARYSTPGESRLVHMVSIDEGLTWGAPDSGTLQDATVILPSGSAAGFDGDDVGGPALVRQNGAWELYFTGRRGARTAIGVLSSFDLRHWWNAGAGEAMLSASGSGFDSLGVSEPAVFSLGGTLVMLYAGTDGANWRIGRVERAATEHRGP